MYKLFSVLSFFSYLNSNLKFHPYSELIDSKLQNVSIESTIKDVESCKEYKSTACKIYTKLIWERKYLPSCFVEYLHEFNFEKETSEYKTTTFQCKYIEEVPLPIRAAVANHLNSRTDTRNELVTMKSLKSLVYRYTADFKYDDAVKYIRAKNIPDFMVLFSKGNDVITTYVSNGLLVVGEKTGSRWTKSYIRYTTVLVRDTTIKLQIYVFDFGAWTTSAHTVVCSKDNKYTDCFQQIRSLTYDFTPIQ